MIISILLITDPRTCVLWVESVECQESGVEVDQRTGDVHGADTGHVIGSVITTQVTASSDSIRFYQTICVQGQQLEHNH